MANIDTTTYIADLKEVFAKSIEFLLYEDNPFLGKLPKDKEGGGGTDIKVPVVYGGNIGLSASFTVAQAAASVAKSAAFSVPPMSYWGIVDVPNTAIRQTEGNKKAFMQLMSLNLKTLTIQFSHRLAQLLFGSGWGDFGIVGATTTDQITFASRSSVVGVEAGDGLVFASAQSGVALRNAGAVGTVLNINRLTGVVNFVTSSLPAAVAPNDFVFHSGDRDLNGTTMQVPMGVQGYIPPSNTFTASLFGLDRSIDRTRLAGTFITAQGGNLPTIYRLVSYIKENGGKTDAVYLSSMTFAQTILELNGNVRYVKDEAGKEGDTAVFSYEGVKVAGPAGPVTLYLDPNLPDGIAFAAEMSSWELWTIGEVVRADNPNGEMYMQRDNAPTTECRLTFQGNLLLYIPGHNGIATGLAVAP